MQNYNMNMAMSLGAAFYPMQSMGYNTQPQMQNVNPFAQQMTGFNPYAQQMQMMQMMQLIMLLQQMMIMQLMLAQFMNQGAQQTSGISGNYGNNQSPVYNGGNDYGKGQVNSGNASVQSHGGWGGTQGPIEDLTRIAGPGVHVSSAKRSRQHTLSGGVSDHYSGNTNAYAHDLSWGSSQPTAESDAAASRVVASLGGPPDWGRHGGVFNKTVNGVRYQIIYRSNVGGNHFNHIHMGARRV